MKAESVTKPVSPSLFFPLTTVLVALTILWGNLVASTGAGLACPDWPLCHGKLIPPLRADVLIEWSHRLIAASLSICAIITTIIVFRSHPPFYKKIIAGVLILIGVQVVLGGLTVLLKLPPAITVIHLANSMLIYMLFLYMTFLSYRKAAQALKPSLFFLIPLSLVYAQSVLGGIVRHTGAGLECPDFPTCLGQWIPPVASMGVWLHYIHRTFAYVLFAVFCGYAVSLWKRGLRKQSVFMAGGILLQITLGVILVLSQLSIFAAVLHAANALLIVTFLMHQAVHTGMPVHTGELKHA